MNDQESKSIVADKSDDSTSQLYELIGLLENVGPTKESAAEVPEDETLPVFQQPVEEDNWKYPAKGINHPNRNPYEEQYYMQHMHLSSVLERGLTGIHSELCQLSRSVLQLAYGMKDCADTMAFYTTRMLAFHKEMLYITSKTNSSLQTGVHLLQELKAKHCPCPTDTSKANNGVGKPTRSDDSRSKRRHRNDETSSSEDNNSHHSKRDKKK